MSTGKKINNTSRKQLLHTPSPHRIASSRSTASPGLRRVPSTSFGLGIFIGTHPPTHTHLTQVCGCGVGKTSTGTTYCILYTWLSNIVIVYFVWTQGSVCSGCISCHHIWNIWTTDRVDVDIRSTVANEGMSFNCRRTRSWSHHRTNLGKLVRHRAQPKDFRERIR